MDVAESLEKLIAAGRDGATLRFALGAEYLKRERHEDAIRELGEAVRQDPGYSAAWKLLGKAQAACGAVEEAERSFARGIEVAVERGDEQAAREMRVFLRRLSRS